MNIFNDKFLIIIFIALVLFLFNSFSNSSKLLKEPMNPRTPYVVDEGDILVTLTPTQILDNEFMVMDNAMNMVYKGYIAAAFMGVSQSEYQQYQSMQQNKQCPAEFLNQ